MKRFLQILINISVANTATFFLWNALSFWLYIETRSVLILSILGGTYMTLVTLSGMFFGTIADKHRKKHVIAFSLVVACAFLVFAGCTFLFFDVREIGNISSPAFWIFSLSILSSAIVSNLRAIALSTTVSILVPKENYANANGLIGMVQGFAMIANTVFSGLVIGHLGLEWAMYITLVLSGLSLVHLFFVPIPESSLHRDPELRNKQIDFKGAIKAIRSVPGLMPLIFFTTFNNFIGGIIMVLLDPYGLTMFSVEVWGIVLGITGTGFIFGGMIISRRGLGKNPLRTLLCGYVVGSLICVFFTLREWQWLLVAGIFLYMLSVPFIEAAEQTIIQSVVPKIKQGRVFGFAQTVESAATPVSSFLIGPLAQFSIIPFMDSNAGKQAFGWLLGEGNARGIGLSFTLSGLSMLLLTLFAFRSKAYKRLSALFRKSH